MARLPRLSVAGHVHHVQQRGHNSQSVFIDDEDREAFLAVLRGVAQGAGVAVHGYVLLDNEVQLLVTPSSAEGLSKLMQAVSRRHGVRFNQRHGRLGTLWSGRFRASVVDPDEWFIRCLCFIETMPALSRGVDAVAWSSAAHHIGERRDSLIADHLAYWSLGNTPFEREEAWRRRLAQPLTEEERRKILAAVRRGVPIGSDRFLARLSETVARPVISRPVGRPRRPERNLSPK